MKVASPYELIPAISRMMPSERIAVEGHTFASLFPNPVHPTPDDHLDPEARAKHWCRTFGCCVWQQYDPLALIVEKDHARR